VVTVQNMKTEIQECHIKLKQITEALTVERTQKGKITRAIAVKTLVDFEDAVISKLKCTDQAKVLSEIDQLVTLYTHCKVDDLNGLDNYVKTKDRAIGRVMKEIGFTGGTLTDFNNLFDQYMNYLKDSAEAVGTTKYEEISGLARDHLQDLEKVIGEKDNLKGVIAKYEADKAAPRGGGDVNAALAGVKAEKLVVDGELVTVKAEVEALKTKYTSTRDELNIVQAKLSLSEDRVTKEKQRTDKATVEMDRLKTALTDETAKYNDLLNKAPTGPPPPGGARPGTARLKDRVTTLLEELQKLVPSLQGQPFVKRVAAITDLINHVFDDITAIHDKRQILTLIAQNLFPTGDLELRRDLDRLLDIHGV
jgi:hypothetical protein